MKQILSLGLSIGFCFPLGAQSVIPVRFNNSTNTLVDPTTVNFKTANGIASTGSIAALGATTSLASDTTYTGPISTRTFTLPSAASSPRGFINYAGTAAAETVITWPASAVRSVGGSGYANTSTFAIGNAEFSLWSDGTDWFLADSTGAAAEAGGGLPAIGPVGSTLKSDGTLPFYATLSNVIELKDDFFNATTTTLPETWLATGSANTGAIGTANANHWGIVRFRSSAADQALSSAGSALDSIVLGAGVCWVEWIIKTTETSVIGTPAVSDATDNFTMVVGLGDTIINPAVQTDGVYFRYNHAVNSGKWERVTESNTSEEALDTGVAYAGSTWIRLGILITDGTSAQFFINGVSVGTNGTDANIPTGTTRLVGILCAMDRTAGTAERNYYVDAFHLVFKPTTPR